MAIELLNASGLFPLCTSVSFMHACIFTESLENLRHAHGMNDTVQNTDNAWVSIDSCTCSYLLYIYS